MLTRAASAFRATRETRATTADRWLPVVRRVVLGVVAAPFVMAIVMTLVDSYRRRGKRRATSFPTAPPTSVPVGEGEVTTYTFGTDLYDAMIEAIEGAQRQVLLETYIWKGDEVGQEFKAALQDAAERGVRVHAIYDGFANLVVPRRFKQFAGPMEVIEYPVFAPGLMFFDPWRYGRDHRKILVVDGTVGFVGGFNIGSLYATDWRDTHVRIDGPSAWDLKNAFTDFWNLHRRDHLTPLPDHGSDRWDPRIRVHRNVPRHRVFPVRGMYLEAFDRAGFYGMQIVKRDEHPWKVVNGIEFRSVTVVAYKGKQGPCWERKQAVVYLGPWKRVVDDDGHVLERGKRMAVCDKTFHIYGREPENIYLTILQGRPKGMPAWGGMLPDQVIWDLVAYIRSISKEPSGPWGKTTSADGFTIEQVPAEFQSTVEPWKFTTPFSYGQAPFEHPKGSPPLETPK